ncbi:hypothetical protein [Nonomuraea sp. NPDC003754]
MNTLATELTCQGQPVSRPAPTASPGPRPAKLLHIGVALAVTLLAGGLQVGALAWIGLPPRLDELTTGNLLEIIKIARAVVGGAVAYRKQRLAEEDNHQARDRRSSACWTAAVRASAWTSGRLLAPRLATASTPEERQAPVRRS